LGIALVSLLLLALGCGDGTGPETSTSPNAGPTDRSDGPGGAVPETSPPSAPGDQASSNAGDPPAIEFEERSWDFEEVFTYQKPEHVFAFRNTGGSDLVIQRVKPSCTSCTVTDYTHDPIPPGGEGHVRIALTSAVEGKSRKYVDVYTNAPSPQSASVRLTVAADFRQSLWVEPATVSLGRIRQGMRFPSQRVDVMWLADRPLEIETIEPSFPDLVTVESTPFETEGRRGVHLDLRFGDPQLLLAEGNANHVFGSITLHTSDPLHPEILIRFNGEVQEDVVVLPRRLVFARDERGAFEPQRVKLAAAPNANLAVEGEDCSLPYLEVSVEEKRAGMLFEITLSPSDEIPAGSHRGTLTLRTNFERQPEFVVPIEIRG